MKMKHGFLILVMLVVSVALKFALPMPKNLAETVLFFLYGGAWAVLVSACWGFFDELEQESWKRERGF